MDAKRVLANKIVMPQDVFDMVCKNFGGDLDKNWQWFKTPNPSFSYRTPLKMLKEKKVKKVMQFALNQMNFPIF